MTKLREIILSLGLMLPFIFLLLNSTSVSLIAALFYMFGCVLSGIAFYAFGKNKGRQEAMEKARHAYYKN